MRPAAGEGGRLLRGEERPGGKCYFILDNGKPRIVSGYEEAFAGLLYQVDIPMLRYRYSLCWASIEPAPRIMTAQETASYRQNRETKKAESEKERFQQEDPLLDYAEVTN